MEKITMKSFLSILLILSAGATRAWASSLTINGSLIVSNLTAQQTITLGAATLSNWPTTFPTGVVLLANGTLDTSLFQYYTITLTNNVAWTFTNHSSGRVFWLKVQQNASGGWTNSWDANVMWPGHIAPFTSTRENNWDLFHFADDGTNWSGAADGINYTTSPGYALQFNGTSNYIDVPYSSAFYQTSGNFTWSGWFKTGVSQSAGWFLGAYGGISNSYNGYGGNMQNGGQIRFFELNNGTEVDTLSSSSFLNDGSWHLFTFVDDGANMYIYIDGIQNDYAARPGFTNLGSEDIDLGGINNAGRF